VLPPVRHLRILGISNTPLNPATGSGYVATGFAERLRARGHSVDLLGPADFEPLYGFRRGIRYRQALGALLAALRSVRRRQYDVIELWGGENWCAALALVRLPRRRFLVVARSNGLEPHATERMTRAGLMRRSSPYSLDLSWAYSCGFRAVDALVTVSDFDREYGVAHGYARGRVLTIPNPLPDTYLGVALEAEREPQVGFVGNWLPIKGTDLVRGALPSVLREFGAWRLDLIGQGAAFRPEEHFPADVLPRVHARAFADRNGALRSLYRQMAVLVLPSVYESFGLVATEAMACGVALVATRVGFAASLDDGREALLLQEPTSGALTESLRRLMADDTLRRGVAAAGHARVQSLTWKAAVDTLESAYVDWLSAFRGSRRPS
jgi:glycosyltransferase involved in cell wall biosynthesis